MKTEKIDNKKAGMQGENQRVLIYDICLPVYDNRVLGYNICLPVYDKRVLGYNNCLPVYDKGNTIGIN